MPLTITHSTPADGTFSATGATAWNANHSFTVTGTSGQLQYNNAGDFAGMSGTSWNDTTRSLTLTGATVTTSAPVFDLSQTWNNAAVTFTGLKFNATDTASATGSLLFQLQTGGVDQFTVRRDGFVSGPSSVYTLANNGSAKFRSVEIATSDIFFSGGPASINFLNRSFIRSRATANFQLGAADAAAPVAQTLSVQSVVAGTTNTAGANLTITGSQGTGTGAGGSIIFQVAPAGSSGTAQNALLNAFVLASSPAGPGNTEARVVNPGGGSGNLMVATTSNTNSTLQIKHSTGVDGSGGSTVAYIGRVSSNIGIFDGAGTLIVGQPSGSTDSISIWGTDARIARDAANTLALRNGTNAQTFRSYFSFTDASNYTRLALKTASGIHTIETESAGTGEANIDLALTPKGTGRVRYGTHSAIGAETVTGFIEIKDSGGTVRKLAVVS